MDSLILALIPVFAVGLAIQQLLEILDPVVNTFIVDNNKKIVLGIVSLGVGIILSVGCGIRVLYPLGVGEGGFFDIAVTSLIVSAGTETMNSLMKYLGYVKENVKVQSATLKADAKRDYVANDIMFKMNGRKVTR